MKRYHLFEFCDLPWLPPFFRSLTPQFGSRVPPFGIVFRRCTDARQGAAGDRGVELLDLGSGGAKLPQLLDGLAKITGLWCGRR
ncbi:MAG: hypothetical protein U0787_20985 [Polyangia bacterium]